MVQFNTLFFFLEGTHTSYLKRIRVIRTNKV